VEGLHARKNFDSRAHLPHCDSISRTVARTFYANFDPEARLHGING
jgi:hypothetical protein